jgi:ribosome biogenesis protein YTM1
MQVQVRFSTKTDLVVSENVVKLPTDLAPNDLSNVINHMLTLDSAVQFEFLIDGQFLKTSLQKYLDSHNLSTENILEIEYIKATPPPSLEAQLDVEDWITDIHIG